MAKTDRLGSPIIEGPWHPNVKTAAITNVASLSGEQTISSVACTSGHRVLLTAQTDKKQNGPWIVQRGTWLRPRDWVLPEHAIGALFVAEGGSGVSRYWQIATAPPVVIDTTNVDFSAVSFEDWDTKFNANTSAFGRSLVDDTDAAAARTTLGLAAVAASGSASDLSTGTLPIARIADGAVTNAKLADMAEASISGRAAGAGTGARQDLTAAQVRTAIAVSPTSWFDLDIRDTQFAGGAPWNGVDDDAPAIRAAIDYAKTIGSLYNNVGARINIPAGKGRLDSVDAGSVSCLNVTDAHGVYLRGSGRGASQLVSSVTSKPIIKATNTTTLPLHYFGIDEMTLVGPGKANTAAHGIDLGANNNCRISVKVWSCRSGLRLVNSWQTTLDDIRIDGGGSLACYDGMEMLDGNVSVAENAVVMLGGVISGAERYGFRGQCVTGSKFVGAEWLGAGSIGVYLGDSPGNKDLKWATFSGCLIDTAPDLLVIKKGGSTVGELIHFSGMWLGYASEGLPGAGIGVEIDGMSDCQLGFDIIANTTYAALIKNCNRVNLRAGTIKDYDRILTGSPAVIIENSQRCRVDVGSTNKASGSTATNAVVENGTSNRSLITGVFDGAVSTVGAQTNKTLIVT